MKTPDVLLIANAHSLYLESSFTVGNKRFVEFLGDLVLLNPDGTTLGKAYPVKWEAL
jgi:hypothetical protein